MLERTRFAVDGLVIEVGAFDRTLLEAVCGFFDPLLARAAPGARAAWRVEIDFDARAHEVLCAARARAQGTMPIFSMDGPPLAAEVLPDSSGNLVLFEPAAAAAYVFEPGAGRLRILNGSSTVDYWSGPVRAIREIASLCLAARGDLLVHASGVAMRRLGGGAVLFVGSSGAGKTSLALHALGAPGTALLSNDRVFVGARSGKVTARGMPTIVSIEPDTLNAFPLLAGGDWVKSAGAGGGERLLTTPLALCRMLGCRAVPCVPPAAIVFPLRAADVATLHLQRLAPDAAADRLVQHLIGGAGHLAADAFLRGSPDPVPDPGDVTARCRHIADTVPCIDAAIGPELYARVPPEALLDAVTRAAAGRT